MDEKFAPYDDQWAYLSTVRRTEASAVAPYARATRTALGPLAALDAMAEPEDAPAPSGAGAGADANSGTDVSASTDASRTGKPGEQLVLLDVGTSGSAPAPTPGRAAASGRGGRRGRPSLSPADFPAELRIVWRDTLRIPREGLSPAAVNALRRLAAFANPEFHLAQSMRRSVRGIERVIYVGEETPESINLPRGCLDGLRELLERSSATYSIDDRRFGGKSIDVDFRGTLRPEQEPAVQELLGHETGILSAPTGFGKTVVGAALIAELKVSALVLVPRTALLNQWRDELERFLAIREEPPSVLTKTGRVSRKKHRAVGCLGGGKREITGIIDVADYQSLFERVGGDAGSAESAGPDVPGTRRLREFVAQYGLIICDECHHGAAPLLGEALMHVPARRVYGLSATPRREDGLEGIVYLHCGPVRYVYGAKEQARAQGIARVMVPRFLGTRLDETVNENDTVQVQEALGSDTARNAAIVDDAHRLVTQGRTPLVLTKLVEHARTLAEQLERRGVEVHLLVGSDGATVKREKLAALRERAAATEETSARPTFAVVATGSYVGEGFDCAQLDALLLAAPVKSETLVTQFTGRLHRTGPGKTSVLVFDYVDAHIPLLDRMYRARLKTYARLAYKVGSPEDAESGMDAAAGAEPRPNAAEKPGNTPGSGGLIDGSTWIERLLADIDAAQTSIAISATWANTRTVQRTAEAFARARGRGVAVNVQLRLPGSEAKRAQLAEHRTRLEAAGCHVTLAERADGDFAVLDKGLVWYGGISPLGSPKQNECSLRFRNPEVAHELAGACGLARAPES